MSTEDTKGLIPIVARSEAARALNWIKRHWALTALILLVTAGVILFATGRLQVNPSGRRTDTAAERDEGAGDRSGNEQSRVQADKIVLAEDDFKVSGVRIAPVTVASVPALFIVPGEVQLAENRIAHVTPPIAGIVRSVERGVGDEVTEGTPLCSVESVELGDARASYVAAHADTGIAQRNYTRWKLLFEKGLRTENELLAAEAELTRAKLKLESADARLRALGLSPQQIQALEKAGTVSVSNRYTVRSPIRGSVLERKVTVGQNVAASDQVFLIADLAEVWVQGVAQEQDLAGIRKGMSAIVRIPNLPDVAVKGTVTYVGEQVDPKTRTVPLRIVVRNAASRAQRDRFLLRPGLFANAEIQKGIKEAVPVIPISAVQSEGAETFVFVRTAVPANQAPPGASARREEDETKKPAIAFERRTVELGVRSGQLVEVTKGLQVGDEIAVENAYLLKGEMEKFKVQD